MTRIQRAGSGGPVAPRRLGVIYNSASGRHRRYWPRQKLPAGIPAIEAKTPGEIGAAVAAHAAAGVDLLAVAGGDGTVAAVLTHVMLGDCFAIPPILALVPTGSTNMTGTDVGAVNVRRFGWQRLCHWARQPVDFDRRVVERAVLRVKPNAHDRPFCGMFFGAGAIHHAVAYTQGKLHRFGLRGDVGPGLAFMRFIKAAATGDRRYFAPLEVRARDADGQALEGRALLLLATTLRRLVLRLHPFWGQEPGPLAWTAVADAAPGFFYRLPAIARGRGGRALTPGNGYISHNTRWLEIAFDGGYIVDGEFFTARRGAGPVVMSNAGHARFLRL